MLQHPDQDSLVVCSFPLPVHDRMKQTSEPGQPCATMSTHACAIPSILLCTFVLQRGQAKKLRLWPACTRRASNWSPCSDFSCAVTLQYSCRENTSICASLSHTSLSATDCTRPDAQQDHCSTSCTQFQRPSEREWIIIIDAQLRHMPENAMHCS